MDRAHTIDVLSITQFPFSVRGGNNITLSIASPTNDGFYDSGSVLTATTDYSWSIVNGTSRQHLVAYTIDGQTTGVGESGARLSFSAPTLSFDRSHDLVFVSGTQYFVKFSFTDNAGQKPITPTLIQIDVSGAGTLNLTGPAVWLNNGSSFSLAGVLWEGADVKPSSSISFNVASPLSPKIQTRVYDARLRVTDYLGLPVAGAGATIELANGTTLSRRTTAQDGTVLVPEIPQGRFTATVSSFGVETKILGDASTHATTDLKVLASAPFVAVITMPTAAGIAGVFLALRHRRARRT
jgi:hypothetical protein